MEFVATIIAGPGAEFPASFLQKLIQESGKAGTQSARASWLAEGEAADIFGTGVSGNDWRNQLKNAIADEPFDFIVQPAATRRKKLLAADMESTVIEQELLDELAGEIGMRAEVTKITRRSMNGEIDFGAALRARVALLKGKPASILDKVATCITYTPGAKALVATMKANGAQTWLITGGFSCYAKIVAATLGFDRWHANELVIENGMTTGMATEPILDRNRKKTLLEEACAGLKISLADSLAVGDGANDVPMLAACNEGIGLGIAFQAKPKVRAAVPNQINHGDLTALLYVQGYKKEEWAA